MTPDIIRLSNVLAALGRATTQTEIPPVERWQASKIVLDYLLEQYEIAKAAPTDTGSVTC